MSNLSANQLISSNEGNLYFIPSGSATVPGTAIAANATAHSFVITCSAQVNNIHTPSDGTSGSYIQFSTPEGNVGVGLYYISASVELSESYATESSSISTDTVTEFYDESLIYASSSYYNITSFSSSQSPATGNQFAFILSGSGGKVFEFIPTGSMDPVDLFKSESYVGYVTRSYNPFIYAYSGSDQFSVESPEQTASSFGVSNLVNTINVSQSYFGVSASISASTLVNFTANTGSGTTTQATEWAFTFFTQSLVDQSILFSSSFSDHYHQPVSSSTFINIEVVPGFINLSPAGTITSSFTSSVFNTSITESGISHTGSFTSYQQVLCVITSSNTATSIAERTRFVLTNNAYVNSAFIVSQSAQHVFITDRAKGALLSSEVISSSATNFSHSIINTGTGNLYAEAFIGLPNTASAANANIIDPDSSFILSGSGQNSIYMSGSGNKIGINTTDPQTELDFRADEMQFQKREQPKGIKINQEGNIESYDSSGEAAATGSELIIKYSRGTTITADILSAIYGGDYENDAEALAFFNTLKPVDKSKIFHIASQEGFLEPAQAGDVLGSIRWVAESGSSDSLNSRVQGEAAAITAVVNESTDQGVRADLLFKVAGKTGAAEQKFLLDASNQHELTGSLNITQILYLPGIPTSDPGIAGAVWRYDDNLKISLG